MAASYIFGFFAQWNMGKAKSQCLLNRRFQSDIVRIHYFLGGREFPEFPCVLRILLSLLRLKYFITM